VDFEIIKKSGSWFSYGDKKIGQGRDAVKEALKNDPALMEEIELRVRAAMSESER
jgi:recombination protein RecA